jgi:beta-glucosidase
MSLSWSRIIPKGGRNDPINKKGIQYYRTVIQTLLDNHIEPMVTLFHWDTPQAPQDRYEGFLNKTEIVQDFERYARVCLENFGDLVRLWLTINEPNIYSILGHAIGAHSPGRSSNRDISEEGDSLVEPFLLGHNLLLAHATTVKLYRTEFQKSALQRIGIVINVNWGEPYDDTDESESPWYRKSPRSVELPLKVMRKLRLANVLTGY